MGQDDIMADLFNLEAEASVLGFLLSQEDTVQYKDEKLRLIQIVLPEHFTDPQYQAVYSVIKSQLIFDKIMLYDAISNDRNIDVKAITLTKLPAYVSIYDVMSYVNIITEKFQKRRLYDFGREIQESVLKGDNQFEVALKAQAMLSSMASKKTQIETNVQLLERVLNEQPGDVLSTGYPLIDKFVGGYARGMLITIAGDSGHLKTTYALDKAFRMAERNPSAKIGIFSKEMLATDLMKKQISRICGIPISKIFGQEYDKEYVRKQMMKIEAWRDDRIKIINPNSFSGVGDIAKIQLTYNFDIWFLDFIQLLEFAKTASNSSDYNIQIGQNMRNLQSLALATKSVGIILSQVKKGIEFRKSKKPTVSDIEWSGLIKQLSSYIFFSYYPGKYYGFDVLKEDEYFLLAEKTRFAENFVYPMIVDPALGTFTEIESPDERMQRVNKLRQVVD